MLTSEQIQSIRRAFLLDWLQSADRIPDWASRAVDARAIASLPNPVAADRPAIEQKVASMNVDGSWPDVDYTGLLRENWAAITHFTRYLHPLTVALLAPGSVFADDPSVKRALLAGIDFWLRNDFRNPNWWFQVNGLPAYFMGPVLVAMRPLLTVEQREAGIRLLERSNVKASAHWRNGGNGLFDCRAALMLGLLEDNAVLIEQVYDPNLLRCLQPSASGDGVKADWSHWEHGPLPFNHGYGAALLQEGGRLIWYAREAGYSYSASPLEFLTSYLLEGSAWMSRNGFLDPAAWGRSIAVPQQGVMLGNPTNALYVVNGARYLILAGSRRSGELEALIAAQTGRGKPLTGNRMFSCSDLMTHHAEKFYASVRMFSRRTLNTEICNGVNRLGHHLGEGSIFLTPRGDEYAAVFPCWDWNRVPGTTVNLSATENSLLDEIADSGWIPCRDPEQDENYGRGGLRLGRLGRTAFAGGASDGRRGAGAMHLAVRSLRARKSVFFDEAGMVLLGAGISDTEPGEVATTVNQCLLRGPVRVLDADGQERVLDENAGDYKLSGAKLVHHDDVAYLFAEGQQVVCANGLRRGDWRRINLNLSETAIDLPVFALWIEHGEQPQDGDYAVRVVPGIGFDEAARLAADRPMADLLRNTRTVQAVRQRSGLAVVFHEAAALELGEAGAMASNGPLVVLSDGAESVTLADPTHTARLAEISIRGRAYSVVVESGRSFAITLREGAGPPAAASLPDAFAAQTHIPERPGLDLRRLEGRIAVSSSDGAHGPESLCGETSDRYWQSASGGEQWVQADFGQEVALRSVRLDWIAAPLEYELQVSADGTYFTPLMRVRRYGLPGPVEYGSLFVQTRFVRIFCTEPGAAGRYALRSIGALVA